MRMRTVPAIALSLAAAAAAACSGADPAVDADLADVVEVVTPGKADDYASPTAQEYRLRGTGRIDLDGSWWNRSAAARRQRAEELLGYKLAAYSHFINLYLTDKPYGASNADYGGFSCVVRRLTKDAALRSADGAGMSWTFDWEIELGGPSDLLSSLPTERKPSGERFFVVQLPVLSEWELEAGAFSISFEPASYGGALAELEVSITPEASSIDAYPNYPALFADGKLEIAIIVGGDYYEARYDLQGAEELFDWLKGQGYQHPASHYTQLTLGSPPFRGSLVADGRPIDVEITLLHPEIVPDAHLDELGAAIIEAYQSMDVLLYSGHAGVDPTESGVAYHYNPRHAITAMELAELDLPTRYQLYIFHGCKTYSAYPDAVYTNDTKTPANLDVISAVSFGLMRMSTVTNTRFLEELLATQGGTHDPRTYLELLTTVNEGRNQGVYYGVHGIDDNAHLNPYAELASLCDSCGASSDCPGQGNSCVRLSGGKACAAECTDDDACPAGYACTPVGVRGEITSRQCLPSGLECH
ncbi:MAG: hypothetical protein JRI23_29420 [Deltaproteobacteria bacterium]|nr:hypothetical protein [Deltaproteobacteria bacterium]MBW2536273.1 hypothetical protein [Deltaproteobacteria bacterium]